MIVRLRTQTSPPASRVGGTAIRLGRATALAATLLAAASVQAAGAAPTSGLVGHWAFDEGTGTTAADGSGNGRKGTLEYGPTWAPSGACRIGGCLSFDGTDDYVRVANSAALRITGNITISAWIKPTGSRTVQSALHDQGGVFSFFGVN